MGKVRNAILQAAAAIVPLLLACAVCASKVFYGENYWLFLPGVIIGLTPALMGICHGGKMRIRLSSLIFAAGLLITGWVVGYVVDTSMGLLTSVYSRPTLHLLAGILLGSSVMMTAGKGEGLWEAKKGWLEAAALTIVVATVLTMSITATATSFSSTAPSITPATTFILTAQLLLPLAMGFVLACPKGAQSRVVWLSLGVPAAVCLVVIMLAIFAQMNIWKTGWGEQLNTALYRKAAMEGVTSCLLVGIGMCLRNAMAVMKKHNGDG